MSSEGGTERAADAGRTAWQLLEEAIISGLAVIVPIVVTVLVLNVVFGYVLSALSSLLSLLEFLGVRPSVATVIVYAGAIAVLAVVVIAVGFLTRFRYGELFLDYFDFAFSLIPGIGSVYESFREMSEVMMQSDTRSFRDVKAVEFPHEGAYTLGFVTTETPDVIRTAVGGDDDMLTLFLPLAPNPVMGGHLAHIPADRVYDVDMSVEEGIRTVVTSGVAVSEPTDDEVAEARVADLADVQKPKGYADGSDRTEHAGPDIPGDDRQEKYREDIDVEGFRGEEGGDGDEAAGGETDDRDDSGAESSESEGTTGGGDST